LKTKKGRPFVWRGHDCHEDITILKPIKNIYGEFVKIDPKRLDPAIKATRF
jgi:hypothetical protein